MDINFELYKIFYIAAKEESFSQAAKSLFISQSAVSQSIKKLEERLDTQLFFRKSRSIRLTSEGELLFKYIKQANNLIKSGENEIHQLQELIKGEIRIGASDTVCKYHLISYLKNFYESYPNIKIQLVNRTSSQIINILKNGLIDFGIITLPVYDKNIYVEKFINVNDIFVASNKYSELVNKRISIGDLLKYPLLMLDKNSSTRKNFDNFLHQNSFDIIPEIEFESVDLLVEFAKIGFGIAHVLEQSAEKSIIAGELFKVNTIETLPNRSLGIITYKSVPISKTAKKFIEFIKK